MIDFFSSRKISSLTGALFCPVCANARRHHVCARILPTVPERLVDLKRERERERERGREEGAPFAFLFVFV